jgi:hypothetical protein
LVFHGGGGLLRYSLRELRGHRSDTFGVFKGTVSYTVQSVYLGDEYLANVLLRKEVATLLAFKQLRGQSSHTFLSLKGQYNVKI